MSKPLPVFQPLSPPGAEHLVEVGFKGIRRAFYTTSDPSIVEGDHVVVEAERGLDLGRVRSVGGVARSKCTSSAEDASASVVRRAEPEEVRQAMVLRADEDRIRRQTRELVDRFALKMKVTETEWQWDRNKLTIFFTADRRVDFRELVRELARSFRTRIELKQIGVRDEAAMLGGMGRCGRQLCCATWLREIRPVSLQLAKDQNLSLNPSQISGTCGRLMCCLTYEHDAYVQARKRYPREGKILQTAHGPEKVIGIDIWRESLLLMDENRQRRTVTLVDLKAELAAPAGAARDEGAAAERPAEAPRGRAGTERARPHERRGQVTVPEPAPEGPGEPRAEARSPRRPPEPRQPPAQRAAEPAAPAEPARAAAPASPDEPTPGGATRERGQRPPRRRGGGKNKSSRAEGAPPQGETVGAETPQGAAEPPQAGTTTAERRERPARRRRGRRGGGEKNG